MIAAAPLDLSALVALWDRLAADIVLGGIGSELERVTEYVASQAPAVVPRPSSGTSSVVGGGGHSCCTQEQFARLARCESGTSLSDPSPWRTGWFGIEAGYPIGNLSLAEQEAWVMRIFAQYGSRAWGCAAAFG